MQRLDFRASIHVRQPGIEVTKRAFPGTVSVGILKPSMDELAATFDVSFEAVEASLGEMPRMFIEPDGSFVWRPDQNSILQLDGCLFDDGQSVTYVELAGSCTDKMLDQILQPLGWPLTQVMFLLRDAGIYLSETDFRQIATVATES